MFNPKDKTFNIIIFTLLGSLIVGFSYLLFRNIRKNIFNKIYETTAENIPTIPTVDARVSSNDGDSSGNNVFAKIVDYFEGVSQGERVDSFEGHGLKSKHKKSNKSKHKKSNKSKHKKSNKYKKINIKK